MTSFIFYPSEEGLVTVMPTGELPIEEVAKKDVPAGVPYKIVPREYVPVDFDFIDAWEVDFSEPDGYGIGSAAWFELQLGKEQNSDND